MNRLAVPDEITGEPYLIGLRYVDACFVRKCSLGLMRYDAYCRVGVQNVDKRFVQRDEWST